MLKKRLEEAGDDFRRDAQNCSEKTEREEMRQNQVVSCGDLFRKKKDPYYFASEFESDNSLFSSWYWCIAIRRFQLQLVKTFKASDIVT